MWNTCSLSASSLPQLLFSSFAVNSRSGFSSRSQEIPSDEVCVCLRDCVPVCRCSSSRARLSGQGNGWVQWNNYTAVMYSSIFRGNHILNRYWLHVGGEGKGNVTLYRPQCFLRSFWSWHGPHEHVIRSRAIQAAIKWLLWDSHSHWEAI